MVGKFLLGMVSGGLLVTGGLAVSSAMFPVRPANDNQTAAAVEEPITAPEPTAVEPTPEAAPAAEEPAAKPVEEAAPAVEDAAEVAPPVEETATAEPAAEAAPVAEPAAEAEPEAEPVAEAAPDLGTAGTSPEAPVGESAAVDAAPTVPELADVVAPETPAQPPKPPVAEADVAAAEPEAAPAKPAVAVLTEDAPAAEPAPEPAPEPGPVEAAPEETAEAALPEEAAPAPEAAAEEATPEVAVTPEPVEVAPESAEGTAETAEVAPAAPEVTTETAEAAIEPLPEVTPELTPEPEAAPAVEEPPPMVAEAEADAPTADAMPGERPDALPGTETEVAEAQGEAETEGGSTFKPAPGLIKSGEGVITDRLPKIGEAAAETPAEEAVPPADPRPIAVNAVKLENPDNKPGFAVVLIDPGSADLDRAALAALPFPVSFALDPLDPATPERAALYRAAGREVVMIATGIAEGSQPSDVEVAFQSMELGLPEAVAVMDLAVPKFQNNRLLASAVVPIVKAQGRGLLTWDAGLNAADQVARRDDLEAAVVFRDLGSAGGDRTSIRRLLDRAVFKAAQDGRVAVVGEADAETVAALLEWTVEGKAATVALAPLTAVLKVD